MPPWRAAQAGHLPSPPATSRRAGHPHAETHARTHAHATATPASEERICDTGCVIMGRGCEYRNTARAAAIKRGETRRANEDGQRTTRGADRAPTRLTDFPFARLHSARRPAPPLLPSASLLALLQLPPPAPACLIITHMPADRHAGPPACLAIAAACSPLLPSAILQEAASLQL